MDSVLAGVLIVLLLSFMLAVEVGHVLRRQGKRRDAKRARTNPHRFYDEDWR